MAGGDNAHKTAVPALLVSFVCGIMLGLGVAFGGMTDARKTSSFFNITNLGTKYWDPSLAIMFAAAVASNSVVYYLVMAVMKKPAFAPKFCIPSRRDTPLELFVGAAMFGAGWGLGGFCPGPAIVASWEGHPKTLLFLGSMVVGMAALKLYMQRLAAKAASGDDKAGKHHPHLSTAVLSGLLVVVLATVAYAYSEARASGQSASEAVNTFYLHPLRPALGGVLIGVAVATMMALTGEILGISGIVSGLFSTETSDKAFRVAFVAGLVTSAAIMWNSDPSVLMNRMHRPWFFFVLGGFLVGFGTGLGSGCTSGHGVAGLTRLSKRSIFAVATFFAANIAVTTLLHTVGIGTGWKLAMEGSG